MTTPIRMVPLGEIVANLSDPHFYDHVAVLAIPVQGDGIWLSKEDCRAFVDFHAARNPDEWEAQNEDRMLRLSEVIDDIHTAAQS